MIYGTGFDSDVWELASVGEMCGYTGPKHLLHATSRLKNQLEGRKGLVMASLTKGQTVATKFLLDYGFEQVGSYIRNPNSSNMIALFVLQLGRKKPSKRKVKK